MSDIVQSNFVLLTAMLDTLDAWDRERWQILAIESRRRGLINVNPYLATVKEAQLFRPALNRLVQQ